ncbi:MAG: hypothetical protein JXP34_02805 [Planctomycetes bacterium]|nr:hypothetical protein [Planctomycetota bacterium]
MDRFALVTRHNIELTGPDPAAPLQVGNGEFAFGVDGTGLQTFYGNTMSHWGWHTALLPPGKRIEDFELTEVDTYGRKVGYAIRAKKGQEDLYAWLRENPHRLNLGRIGLEATRKDGAPIETADLAGSSQKLDLWTGIIASRFEIEGAPVKVVTACHPERDAVAARIESPLLAAGRARVAVAFGYGSPQASGADWTKPGAHRTEVTRTGDRQVDLRRRLDADGYSVRIAWSGGGTWKETGKHAYTISPGAGEDALEVVCAFSPNPDARDLPAFGEVLEASARHWKAFWSTGGAIDLSASRDPRWKELERRIVLSQYLLAVNEAGSLPPQETGLSNNSWNGKFHLEMHWWHGAHYALWNRWPMMRRSLSYYRRILPAARELARQQGYRGARWPKMVGPDGRDSPSGVGPLIIWQQPHPIWYAEMDYRLDPCPAVLATWSEIVFATAEFLASFAVRDPKTGRYVLGPPIKTVPENADSARTRNPAFELSYWRYGLRVAQTWRERLGLEREPEWDRVLKDLAPLPAMDGVYLQQEGMEDTYTKMNWEHPSLVGVYGMLPGDGADPETAKRTVKKVWETWRWERCWGWDFPMMAMAAARVGEPAIAVDALLHPSPRNTYTVPGGNIGGRNPYYPGNGGLLYAVAMMACGWEGAPARHAPGFPDDGSWVVRWEGLRPAP